MSDRLDNEQLKAKIGQILYNEFITGRLKEEVLGQFLQRGPIDLSYSLGRDSNGDEICINARIYRRPAQLESIKQQFSKTPRGSRKYVFFVMSSEKSKGMPDNTLRNNFEEMLTQSLPWWDRYNMRSTVNVRDWRLDKTIVSDGNTIASAMRRALKMERLAQEESGSAVSDLV